MKLKNFFHFTRSERNGIFVLLIILLISLIIRIFFDIIKTDKITNYDIAIENLDSFKNSLIKNKSLEKFQSNILKKYDTIALFNFNPNNCTDKDFAKLGFTDKQINNIRNYQDKIGEFNTKSDFSRIYSINSEQFKILENFIQLPDNKKVTYSSNSNKHYNKPDNKENNAFRKADSLFFFDPNTASDLEFNKLGLSNKDINVIRNYQSKGGKFYNNEDFEKMYCITEQKYSELQPYIKIQQNNKAQNNNKKIAKNLELDINTATQQQLVEIKGIGDYTASMIIKYRNTLGGYVSINQLKEVYGVRLETYNNIKKNFILKNPSVTKLRINFATEDELKKHPYLRFYEARGIVEHRNKKGPYKSIDELKEQNIIEEFTFTRIKPYLTVD